jgi:Protein of unknown function (DUF3237)
VIEPRFRPLFTITFQTTPQVVGLVPAGYFRRAGIVTGGSFEGERLRGKALPGGSDWVLTRPDGVTHIDVRAILETDAGETISMTYGGRLRQPADAVERVAAGQTLTEDELYFRTTVLFETAASSLLWLNDIVAVGIGHRPPTGPVYRVFELL